MTAIATVKNIANQMKNPELVQKQILSSAIQSSDQSAVWSSLTLSHGYPGILMFFATLDEFFPDEKWDLIAHQYVIKIKEAIEAGENSDLSMFGGLTGSCLAIQQASKGKTRYQKLLNTLNSHLFNKVNEAYFDPIQEKIDLNLPIHPSLYDAISGICGIGAYALKNLDHPLALPCLTKILRMCTLLTRDIKIGSYLVPGWYIPAHYQFTEADKKAYPKGNFNLGVAHGIPGVLAFLSISAMQGILVEGQMEAIEKITHWIYSKKKYNKETPYWTYRISFEEEILNMQEDFSEISMEAWCYGSAGIVRTLYLAGKALQNQELQQTAIENYLPINSRININDHSTPTFCHGLAGVLTLTRLMAKDSKSADLEKFGNQLEQELLNRYNPANIFGFKDKEITFLNNSVMKERRIVEVDKVGLLEGVSGILLALMTKHTNCFSWTYPFLIEGN
ncbi:lanthionine synthetase C family protein [Candidatus Protochlamydia sp. W-9]|uniref:lanthionine synthetase C family protein n=1 Tax=Candidatus Protochlamydia sp. W-9 TaxID=1785087 RepID=UPI00096A386F|nr:lanthionine synthetase C family protein [Candidatus Protochlamydia sp. W-9]